MPLINVLMRDDFSKKVKDDVSKRVGLRCSNPYCRHLTIGPNSDESKTTNVGVAAHIAAASPGGHRYDESQSKAERMSISNAIWLCQTCAKLIDSDPEIYTVELLKKWKVDAESYTYSELTNNEGSHNFHFHNLDSIPKQLTFQVPTLSSSEIFGRDNDLNDLYDFLFKKGLPVVINGIGGIGKTTLAQVYVHKYYNQYKHIAWISFNSQNPILSFVQDAVLIKNLNINTKSNNVYDQFSEIINRLNSIDKYPKLLVIDNVTSSITEILSALPSQPNWHIILTSREEIFGYKIQHLDNLSPSESFHLFKKYCPRLDITDNLINQLLKAIDYHPLTIEVLSKSAQKQLYDFGQIQKAIETDLRVMVDTLHNQNRQIDKIEKITSYLSSIFNLDQLSEYEQHVLKQFCFLPPEFYSSHSLNKLINFNSEANDISLNEVLNNLAEKGWLLKNELLGTFRIHRIILNVAIKNLRFEPDDIQPLIKLIRVQLYIDSTKDNPNDTIQWIPYGVWIVETFRKTDYKELSTLKYEIFLIESRLGTLFQYIGNYKLSKQFFESALQTAEEIYGKNSIQVAILSNNLSLVVSDLGNYKEALIISEEALNIGLMLLNQDDPELARLRHNLGLIYRNLGDNKKAIQLIEKATESDLKHFGDDHTIIALRFTNLASIYADIGDFKKAVELSNKSLTIQLKIFGENHSNTLSTLFTLGNIYFDLKDINNAYSYFLRAYKVANFLFPPFHPLIAKALSNLGSVYLTLNNPEKAKYFYDKALIIFIKIFGEDHPDVAELQNNLAWVFIRLNQREKAILLWKKALNTYNAKLGSKHPMTLNIKEYLIKFKLD